MVVAEPAFYKVLELMAADIKTIKEKLAGDADSLKPLCSIVDMTPGAARKRIMRDPNLRAMGVPMPNGQLFFRPAEVLAYFKTRGKNGGR